MLFIYQIVNTGNGNRYIGQTKEPSHRKSCHFYELHKGIHKNKAMQRDFTADPKAFEFEIVCECNECEADGLERYFIAKYKEKGRCYNISPGRTENGGNETSKETRDKASKAKIGNQYMRGKRLSDEWRKNLSEAQPHKKKVICMDTGEVFDSFADAARKTGLNRSKIVSVCTGKRKTTGGMRFRYAE